MAFDTLIIFPQLLYFDQEDNGGLSLALQVLYIFCEFVKHNACIFVRGINYFWCNVYTLDFNGSWV